MNHNEDPLKPKFKERKEDISELRVQVSESCWVPCPVKETEPPCDIQTPRRADHDGFQRKDSRSYVGQEPEQCPAQGAGGQCRQDTQGKLFLPCSSHLSRQKRETQAEEDQPESLKGIPVPGSDKHREMDRFVTVEHRKTTSCSRRWTARQPTTAEGSDPCPPGSPPGPLVCKLSRAEQRGQKAIYYPTLISILTPQVAMLARHSQPPAPSSCAAILRSFALPSPARNVLSPGSRVARLSSEKPAGLSCGVAHPSSASVPCTRFSSTACHLVLCVIVCCLSPR